MIRTGNTNDRVRAVQKRVPQITSCFCGFFCLFFVVFLEVLSPILYLLGKIGATFFLPLHEQTKNVFKHQLTLFFLLVLSLYLLKRIQRIFSKCFILLCLYTPFWTRFCFSISFVNLSSFPPSFSLTIQQIEKGNHPFLVSAPPISFQVAVW